jgi:hypothetical protein
LWKRASTVSANERFGGIEPQIRQRRGFGDSPKVVPKTGIMASLKPKFYNKKLDYTLCQILNIIMYNTIIFGERQWTIH